MPLTPRMTVLSPVSVGTRTENCEYPLAPGRRMKRACTPLCRIRALPSNEDCAWAASVHSRSAAPQAARLMCL